MRENGFVILDESMEVLDYKSGKYSWFKIDDDYYMFKDVDSLYSIYKELFVEEVAKVLGISTVYYDLAMFKSSYCVIKGVISRDYNPFMLREVTLNEIVLKYYYEVLRKFGYYQSVFTLEDVWDALDYYYKDNIEKDMIVGNLMRSMVNSFILQVCVGNVDMHGCNLRLVGDKLSLNYDYGSSFCINMNSTLWNYCLKVSSMEKHFFEKKPKDTLNVFLNVSGEEYRDYFFEKVSMLPNALVLFKRVEEKIHGNIPRYIKFKIGKTYEKYRNYLFGLDKERILKNKVNVLQDKILGRKRRIDGYIILDDMMEVRALDRINIYNINNEDYVFKEEDTYKQYYEVFSSVIAQVLNIKTVSYDLVMVNGRKGVISKRFNSFGFPEISIGTILDLYYYNVLDKYNHECDFNALYNLETIWDALSFYFSHNSLVVESLMRDIVDSFILQVCIGNGDMNWSNIKIIDSDNPEVALNFDYGEVIYDKYLLTVGLGSSLEEVVNDFLKSSSHDYRNYFFLKVKMMPSSEEIFKIVEKKIKSKIPLEVKEIYRERYDNHRSKLINLALDGQLCLRKTR